MSVRIPRKFGDKECFVEVFENAEIVVHGYSAEDLSYDVSMEEFGEEPSEARQFINACDSGEKALGLVSLVLDRKVYYKEIVLYGADCVEYAINCCAEILISDESSHVSVLKQAVNLARDLVGKYDGKKYGAGSKHIRDKLSEIDEDYILELIDSAEEAKDSVLEYVASATDAVAQCSMLLGAVSDGTTDILDMFDLSARAIAYAAESVSNLFDIWNETRVLIDQWQVKRFVDIMKAIQSQKPWPPLETTK